jgi:L-arabinose isomerase
VRCGNRTHRSAECWLAAGGPHHTVLSTALAADTLTTFAAMTRTELALIDTATTTRAFSNELRWNNAYYKLGGL